jgi:hypothetical protein
MFLTLSPPYNLIVHTKVIKLLNKPIHCVELLPKIKRCRLGLRSHQYFHLNRPVIQNSLNAPSLAKTFDTPCPFLEPMDVANITKTRTTSNSSGFYKVF